MRRSAGPGRLAGGGPAGAALGPGLPHHRARRQRTRAAGCPVAGFRPRRVISPGNGAGPRRRRRPPASLRHSHLLWKLLRTKNAGRSRLPSPSSRPARAARTPRRLARSGTDNKRSPVSPLPALPAPDPAPFRLAGTGHQAPERPGTSPAPARSPSPSRDKLSLTGRDSTEAAPGVAGGGKKETLSLLCFPRVCFLAKKMISLLSLRKRSNAGTFCWAPSRCQRAFLKGGFCFLLVSPDIFLT